MAKNAANKPDQTAAEAATVFVSHVVETSPTPEAFTESLKALPDEVLAEVEKQASGLSPELDADIQAEIKSRATAAAAETFVKSIPEGVTPDEFAESLKALPDDVLAAVQNHAAGSVVPVEAALQAEVQRRADAAASKAAEEAASAKPDPAAGAGSGAGEHDAPQPPAAPIETEAAAAAPTSFIQHLQAEIKKAEKAADGELHAWLQSLENHLTELKGHVSRIPERAHEDIADLADDIKRLF